SSFDTSKGRGRLFHIYGRELYDAIGQPHSRLRRPPSVAHVIDRCMLLDVVLAHPDVVWLDGADEKVVHLTTLAGIPLDDLPHAMVGIGTRRHLQYFPDRLPVGIHPEGRVVLVYLPGGRHRDHVADFIQRHVAMVKRLPAWTISLAEPHHPSDTVGGWVDTIREHLAEPLRSSDRTELRWYFERLKDGHRTKLTAPDKARLERCVASFEGPRFRALYRAWLEGGDRVLEVASSPAIAAALASGAGVVERVTLSHGFRHLSFLVTSEKAARSRTRGAKLGDEVGQWLQPRSRCSRDRRDVAVLSEPSTVGSETSDDVTASCAVEAPCLGGACCRPRDRAQTGGGGGDGA
ncbi:MAG: hypothetical protein AB7N65_09990, partial [Vicinamibacterales bacterium]